jgi:hypothetical protein
MIFSFLQALESSIGQQEQENKKSVEVRLARYWYYIGKKLVAKCRFAYESQLEDVSINIADPCPRQPYKKCRKN